MELQKRIQFIEALLKEAEQKRTALTHAFNAKERAEQGTEAMPGTSLTEKEEEVQYAQELWQRAESRLNEVRTILDEIEQLERQRGVS